MKPFDNGNRLFNLRQQHRSCRHGFRRFSTSLLLTLVSVTLLVSSVNKVPFLFVNALIFNKRVPVVDQWRVLGDGKLTGVVKGHPVIPDGDKITTSPLSNPDFATQAGVTVTTLSGSQYKLETPQASYVAQLRRKQQQNRIVKGVAASQKRGTKAVTKDMDLRAALVSRNEERREKKNGALPMVPILGSLAVVAGVAFNPLKPPSSEITSSPAASSSRNNNVATVFEKVKFPDVSLNKPLIPIPLFDDKEQGVDEKAKAAERAKVEAKQKAIVDKQQTEEQRKGVAQELKIREEEENENLRFEQKLRDQLQEQELLAKKDEEEQSKRQNESKEQNQSVEELARKQEQERLAKVEQQRKKVLELLRIQEEQRARQLALIEQQREEAQRKAAALQEKEQLKQRELELAAQRQKEAEEESAKRYIEMTQKAAAAAAKAQQEKQLLLQKQQQRQQESRALELAAKQQKQAEKERIAIEKKLESELFWGKIKAGVTGIAITGATAFAGVQFLQGSSKTQEENTRKTKSSSSGGTAPFGGKISDAVAGDQAAISTRKNDKLIKEIDSVLENVQGILAEVQDTINPKQEASRKPVPPKTQPTDEMLSNLAFNETETKEEVMLREDISPSFLVEANAESSEGKPNQKNGSSGNDASTPENKIHSTSMQENSLTVSSKSEKVAKAKALEDARNKAAEEAWLMSEKERSSAQPSDEEIKAQALEDARCLAAEEAELGILLEVEKAKAIEEAQQLVQEAVVNEVRQQRNQDFIINQGALKMSQLRLLDILDTTKEQLDKAEIARLEQLIEEKQRIEMDQISKHPLEDPEMGNIELEQEQARQGDNQTRIEIDVQTREDEGVGLSVEMVKAKALEEARTMATRDAMLQAEQDKIVEAQKAKAIWEAQQLAQEAARDEIRLLRNQDLIKSRGALKISQMRLLDVLDATKQQLDLVEIARLEQLIEAKQQAKLKKERAVALLEAERKKIASKRKRQESQLDEQERHQGSASEEKRFRKAEEQRRQAITLAEEDKEKLRALEKEKTEQEAKTEKKDVSSERNRLEMLEQKKNLVAMRTQIENERSLARMRIQAQKALDDRNEARNAEKERLAVEAQARARQALEDTIAARAKDLIESQQRLEDVESMLLSTLSSENSALLESEKVVAAARQEAILRAVLQKREADSLASLQNLMESQSNLLVLIENEKSNLAKVEQELLKARKEAIHQALQAKQELEKKIMADHLEMQKQVIEDQISLLATLAEEQQSIRKLEALQMQQRKQIVEEWSQEQARMATEKVRLEEEKLRKEAEAKRLAKAEEEERLRLEAEAEAKKLAEEEAARIKAEEEERLRLEAEAKKLAEEEAARIKAEEEERLRLEAEAKKLAEEEAARLQAVAEAKASMIAEEKAQRQAEEERLQREVEKALVDAEAAEEQLKVAQDAEAAELAKEQARLQELERMEAIADSLEEEYLTSDDFDNDTVAVGDLMDEDSGAFSTVSQDANVDPTGQLLEELAAMQIAAIGRGDRELSPESQWIMDTIAKSDELYIPTESALANTELLLQEIMGHSLQDYNDKEAFFTAHNIGVYAGSALSVPIRLSTPGTFVEYMIEKKAYDFKFGIVALLDQGPAIKIKEMRPFLQQVRTAARGDIASNTLVDKVLVGAGSVPCTMQFRFENHYSTLLEKVALTYRIQVTPPSAETIMQGRRRRTLAALKVLENDLKLTRDSLQASARQREELEQEFGALKAQYDTILEQWQEVKSQEQEYRKIAGMANPIKYNRNDF